MNADQMIDYVLGQLEGPDCERMEQMIQSDPRIADSGRRSGPGHPTPAGRRPRARTPAGTGPPDTGLCGPVRGRGRARILDYVPVTVPFRWADLAVAASIFIAGILTLVPAIQRSRERMSEAGCMFNLQQLGHSLAQYASINPSYPYPPAAPGRRSRGDVRRIPARCRRPSRPLDPRLPLQWPLLPPHGRPSQLRGARAAPPDRPPALSPPALLGLRLQRGLSPPLRRSGARGNPAGHGRSGGGRCALTRRITRASSTATAPIMARRGQNVLYSDGSARFHPTRRVSPIDSDLYLNNLQELQPGVDEHDFVLVPSYSSFNGQRTP